MPESKSNNNLPAEAWKFFENEKKSAGRKISGQGLRLVLMFYYEILAYIVNCPKQRQL
jgi:hypothetical protein